MTPIMLVIFPVTFLLVVAAVLVLLSANDTAEERQQDIAEQLAALTADAERRRQQRESARADLREGEMTRPRPLSGQALQEAHPRVYLVGEAPKRRRK